MGLKVTDKRPTPLLALCSILLLSACVMPTTLEVIRHVRMSEVTARKNEDWRIHHAGNGYNEDSSRMLPFVTLCFNQSSVKHMVDHNCAFLTKAGYQFHIYTDDLSQPYCSTCLCKPFRLTKCSCPQPERSDCSLCEKLMFMVKLTEAMPTYVFIDSDLIILKDTFMPALQARTAHFDFLAAYGFGAYRNWHYTSQFNSGLMFLRRLDHVNYTKMIDIMYEMSTNNDQNVISSFIQKYYKNWDTLSLRWHCRYLYRKEHNIGFSNCMTFHGRNGALQHVLETSKFQLLNTTMDQFPV